MKKELSEIQKDDIAHTLTGTSGDRDLAICEKYEISLDELEEIMANAGREKCSECEWWCECGELLDDDNEVAPCGSCRSRN